MYNDIFGDVIFTPYEVNMILKQVEVFYIPRRAIIDTFNAVGSGKMEYLSISELMNIIQRHSSQIGNCLAELESAGLIKRANKRYMMPNPKGNYPREIKFATLTKYGKMIFDKVEMD